MPELPWLDDFNGSAGVHLSAKGNLGRVEDAQVDVSLFPLSCRIYFKTQS